MHLLMRTWGKQRSENQNHRKDFRESWVVDEEKNSTAFVLEIYEHPFGGSFLSTPFLRIVVLFCLL